MVNATGDKVREQPNPLEPGTYLQGHGEPVNPKPLQTIVCNQRAGAKEKNANVFINPKPFHKR